MAAHGHGRARETVVLETATDNNNAEVMVFSPQHRIFLLSFDT